MSRTIHLTCGYAFNLIEGLTLSPGDVVCVYDDLSAGPLCELRDVESWRAARLAFWDHVDGPPGSPRERRIRIKSRSEHPIIPDPQRLIDANEIILWLGAGLEDQITLAWMPQYLRALGTSLKKLRIVQFERKPSGELIPRLSVLTSAEMTMAPGPRELGKAEIEYLDRAWAAVTSPRPEALVHMLGEESVPLPLLLAAFRFLFYRYPDVRSGINRHDAKLLAKTRDRGPAAAGVIAYSMMELGEEGDRAGDLVLWWRLRRLADPALPYRALTMTGAKTTIRGSEVHLTAIGEQVARGELNFVELNGIDDWVGGVHLDSRTVTSGSIATARSFAASRSGCGFGSSCPIIKLLSQPGPLRRPDGSAGLLTPPRLLPGRLQNNGVTSVLSCTSRP